MESLETQWHNQAATRNVRLAAIKAFFRFLEHRVPAALEQSRRIHAIPFKKTDSRLVHSLTQQQVQALLDAPDVTTREGLRDRAMLHLAFAAGLRVSELVGLRCEDLTLQPEAGIPVRGKGRRERSLPLWKETTLKQISPHVLRHSIAMAVLQATQDIRKVSLWLGHSSTQTTEAYTRVDPTPKLDTINTLIPPNIRPGRFRPPD